MQALGQSNLASNQTAMSGNAVQENPMGSMLFDENFDAKDRKLSLILFAPIYGALYLINKMMPKLHGGEYEKSISGRLANWGDKVVSSLASWTSQPVRSCIPFSF